MFFLGEEGFIKLGFTNNTLSNSGDNSSDLFVFEVGPAVESMSISLRPKDQPTEDKLINNGFQDPDLDGFYFITDIGGSTAFVDLDAIITGYSPGELLFDAIELKDFPDGACGGNTPGADVDAVCAIYSVDCTNTLFGTATIDECGKCLQPTDPLFNQSCTDCVGTPNGNAIIDLCGECLEPNDPLFNQSCVDCAGTPNGNAIIYDCGECLQPDNPLFNQSCVDCLAVTNGTAIFDECGECLQPTDPLFNQSCADCAGTPNGNAIIDLCGECLEPNDPLFNQSCVDCAGTPNGNAIIDDCGECLQPDNPLFNQSCVDCLGVTNGTAIFDECGECIELNSLLFNQSCTDCAGIPNGTAILDECGECLEPDDPFLNLSCFECELYIPNIFSPNDDGFNDTFRPYACRESIDQVREFLIFDRWGNLMFRSNNFQMNDPMIYWDGTFKEKVLNPGIYIYYMTIADYKNDLTIISGDIALIR